MSYNMLCLNMEAVLSSADSVGTWGGGLVLNQHPV